MLTLGDLAATVAKDLGLSPSFAVKLVTAAIAAIADGLKHGETIRMGGLGKFKIKEVAAHDTVLPTKGTVHVPTWRRPYFVCSRRLREAMNP